MATHDISIRVGLQGGDETTQQITSIGEEADKALQKISEATKPANDNLKLINSTVDEAKSQFDDFAEHAGAVGRVLMALGPAGLIAGGRARRAGAGHA